MVPVELPDNAAHDLDREVARLAHEGREVLRLHVGDPDLETPEGVRDAAGQALAKGRTHYAPPQGVPRLRAAISDFWSRRHRLACTAEDVVVVPAKFAIYATMLATLDPGDEVLFADPSYFFEEPIRLAGGRPVRFPLRDDHSLDLDALNDAISPRTRLLALVTPGNPTGRILRRDELQAAASIANEHKLTVLSDEAYGEIVYEGTHVPFATVAEPGAPVVTVGSFSKTFAMSGWRAGFTIAPRELTRRILQVVENTLTCVPPFVQDACRWALEQGEADARRLLEQLRERRDLLLGRLDDVPGISYVHPEGAVYAFPKIALPIPSVELARRLLNEEGIAVAPGSAFGSRGEGHVRIAYALSPERLDLAVSRLTAFLERLGASRG